MTTTPIPDAAVEAGTAAVWATRELFEPAPLGVSSEAAMAVARSVARAVLTAALPHLTPESASVEEVARDIAGYPIGPDFYMSEINLEEASEIAESLLARFNITPKETDRD